MNKKLLAAAIAAAVVAAPAAFAESVVYGKIHTSFDTTDMESFDVDNNELNSRASRLGFKGSEDLGNGLKAIYQIELSVNSDGGGKGQSGANSGLGGSSRNTFVGLSSDWGTLLAGRHDTPMKVAFYASGNEILGDSVLDLNLGNNLSWSRSKGAPIGVFHEYRASNAVAYISPSFAGFTVAGAFIPGEDTKSENSEGDGPADHYSLGAMWGANGLKASGGYTMYNSDSNDPTAEDIDVWQVGASWTGNAFHVGAEYEDTSNAGFVDGQDYSAWAVTGKFTFGNNAIGAVYTDATMDDMYDSSGWGVSAEHNFSKRTKVYAAYADNTLDYDRRVGGGSDDDSVFSLGMIHDF
jgi:predicted porin